MNRPRILLSAVFTALLALGGCATRPVNPAIAQIEPDAGYRLATRQPSFGNGENLVILAFSGGGTRAAAFSYGVLEFLRRTEIVRANGDKVRLLDAVAAPGGGTLVKPGHHTDWGGYAGYFADPDGFLWEVAWNPKFLPT